MNTEMILPATVGNSFSWSRVWMIARYVFPAIKWQVIGYPLATIVFTLFYILSSSLGTLNLDVAVFSGIVIGAMFYLAPLSLANRDFRSTMAMLPVTASEKLVFLILYLWVYIYLVTSGLNFLLTYLPSCFSDSFECQTTFMLQKFQGLITPFTVMVGVIVSWGCEIFCLYGVITSRSNRMAKGILYSILGLGVYLLVSLIGGIWGAIRFFDSLSPEEMQNFSARMEDLNSSATDGFGLSNLSPEMMKEVMDMVTNVVNPLYVLLGIIAVVCISIMLTKIYKKLQRGGF